MKISNVTVPAVALDAQASQGLFVRRWLEVNPPR